MYGMNVLSVGVILIGMKYQRKVVAQKDSA